MRASTNLPFRLLPLALLASACHTFEPASAPTPAVDRYVRLTLNDSGTAATAGTELGPGVAWLEGRVVALPPDSLTVAVKKLRLRLGDIRFREGTTVTVPRSGIDELQERRVSPVRSVVLAGAIAGGLFLVNTLVDFVSDGGGSGGGPGGGTSRP